jgi:hypothetical protein
VVFLINIILLLFVDVAKLPSSGYDCDAIDQGFPNLYFSVLYGPRISKEYCISLCCEK